MRYGKKVALIGATGLLIASGGCASRGAQYEGRSEFAAQPGLVPARATAKQELGRTELWAGHCSRCHALRPASEYNRVQWSVIVNHMRTVADLPGEDYRRLLEFLAGQGTERVMVRTRTEANDTSVP